MYNLVDDFTFLCSPAEAISRPHQRVHLYSMDAVFKSACGISGNDHLVTRFQSVTCYTLAAERSGSAPLDSPALHDTLGIWSFDVNEGMRVAEIEFDNFARQLDLFIAVVGG